MVNLNELKKWRDRIATVPADLIAMEFWRSGPGSSFTAECNSVGCIIGHCTGLYPLDFLPKVSMGAINFLYVAEHFLGIEVDEPLWDFLFNSEWGLYADEYSEDTNTTQKDFALLRMDYVLKHGEEPSDWSYDMYYSTLKNMM